jgi:hypothetical protein
VRSTYEVKTSSVVRTSTAHGQCTTERASFKDDEYYPLKDEARLFYIRTQCVPRDKHCPTLLYKTKFLMLDKAKRADWSEIHTQQINAMSEQCRIFECKPRGT